MAVVVVVDLIEELAGTTTGERRAESDSVPERLSKKRIDAVWKIRTNVCRVSDKTLSNAMPPQLSLTFANDKITT